MSYLVLARKYRPQSFDTVTGQEHVTKTLANAIKRDKVSHAHLFCGPRGVGKTSIARIFAKALNCANGAAASPCLDCQNCKEITAGTSLAVREIDGASHNSVDNVRDLIESFRSLPPPGSRYKIYIIDEVHMLSIAAFNALLKSLEEPPPNTVFILATTEVHKIPDTVLSRCVRHEFRALSQNQIESRLREVAKTENLTVEPEVFRMITRISDGSMRDAQSLLDRVQSFCEGKLTAAEASKILGTVERGLLFALAHSIIARDAKKGLGLVNEVFARGVDPTIFLKELVTYWRELLFLKVDAAIAQESIGITAEEVHEITPLIEGLGLNDLQDLVHVAREGADAALRSAYSKYALEALIVRMASREPAIEIARVIESLSTSNVKTASIAPVHSTSLSSASPVSKSPAKDGLSEGARAVEGSTARKIEVPESDPIIQQQPRAALDWGEFVQYATTHGARLLTEHLKRLSVGKFEAGNLEARGPKFSVASLERKDNAQQLKTCLQQYGGAANWKVAIQVSDQETEPGSIIHAERENVAKKKQETVTNVSNHPKIKSLQRVFPGSRIEDIKIKE